MRVVFHPIRVPEVHTNLGFNEVPMVEVTFPSTYERFEMPHEGFESEVPLLEKGDDRLRANLRFHYELFHFSLIGAQERDELHFQLMDSFFLNAWLLHSEPKPPRCKAKCEDSGIEGYPCVVCTKGDLTVRVCC